MPVLLTRTYEHIHADACKHPNSHSKSTGTFNYTPQYSFIGGVRKTQVVEKSKGVSDIFPSIRHLVLEYCFPLSLPLVSPLPFSCPSLLSLSDSLSLSPAWSTSCLSLGNPGITRGTIPVAEACCSQLRQKSHYSSTFSFLPSRLNFLSEAGGEGLMTGDGIARPPNIQPFFVFPLFSASSD